MASDGYRILPVPFIKTLQADYLPSALTHEDYPNLIAPGQTVDTIASGTVLFAYNWPKNTDRYRRIDKFVKAFFGKTGISEAAPSSKVAGHQSRRHHSGLEALRRRRRLAQEPSRAGDGQPARSI